MMLIETISANNKAIETIELITPSIIVANTIMMEDGLVIDGMFTMIINCKFVDDLGIEHTWMDIVHEGGFIFNHEYIELLQDDDPKSEAIVAFILKNVWYPEMELKN